MNCLKYWLSVLMAISITTLSWAKPDIVPQAHRDIHRLLQKKQAISLSFQAMSDSINSIEGTTDQNAFELYPSLDLYSEWNDNFDPMNGKKPANLPNVVPVDLSGWYAPIKGMITSPFGWRRRRMHKGLDIKVYVGDTIRAAFDGRVRIRKFERRGYGYYYVIRHENGLETIYGHLSKQIVDQDQYVKAGQAIGLGGSTGRSTGPHLHFEMRYMGVALDPSELIDFNSFEPRNIVYQLDRRQAEWAQNNKGKRGARYRGGASSSNEKQTASSAKGSKADQSASKGGNGVHIIKKGDTLSAIALRYGTTVNRLCKLNGIKANTKLQLGKKIRYK